MSAFGVIKAIVGFYRLDSDAVFERHRSRIPINNADGRIFEEASGGVSRLESIGNKYGLGNYELKL